MVHPAFTQTMFDCVKIITLCFKHIHLITLFSQLWDKFCPNFFPPEEVWSWLLLVVNAVTKTIYFFISKSSLLQDIIFLKPIKISPIAAEASETWFSPRYHSGCCCVTDPGCWGFSTWSPQKSGFVSNLIFTRDANQLTSLDPGSRHLFSPLGSFNGAVL